MEEKLRLDIISVNLIFPNLMLSVLKWLKEKPKMFDKIFSVIKKNEKRIAEYQKYLTN